MRRAELRRHGESLQALCAAVEAAAQCHERRRRRTGQTLDGLERRLHSHELQKLAPDSALIVAVARAMNLPLIAKKPQAAGVVELQLQ